MPRAIGSVGISRADVPPQPIADGSVGSALRCLHCGYALECVEQNRRAGSWVGSFMCPRCRSEYLYAYRWGRLLKKT